MKCITSILFLFLMVQSVLVLSQDKNAGPSSKKVRIEVHSLNQKKLKGRLNSVSDSSIFVYLIKSKVTEEFNYRNLSKVRINKNRAKLIGFLTGVATGALIDAVLISSGYGAEDEIPVGPVLTIFSIPLAGGIAGTIIAKKRISYSIDGKFENFILLKKKIQ